MRSERASDGSSRRTTASTCESMAEASTSRAATSRIDVLVEAGLDDLAEEAAGLPELEQMVARDPVARV